MLPRLKAEENINAVHVVAIGNGVMEKDDQKKILSNWRKIISQHEKKVELTGEAKKIMMMAMGAKVWPTDSARPSLS